ncbi:MAG: hypothetical protein H6765_03155 [Candidatus Peribacteria bacterium]|nr:MAG: hypothetical protein H6765_03155 [Candidatus Peribacteria bacterium]
MDFDLQMKWFGLATETCTAIEQLFVARDTFPSMHALGELYRELPIQERQKYLSYICALRLFSLKQAGITDYGMVCDLDRGNGAISGLDRSFSSDVQEYIALGTQMMLEAKRYSM